MSPASYEKIIRHKALLLWFSNQSKKTKNTEFKPTPLQRTHAHTHTHTPYYKTHQISKRGKQTKVSTL